jgi:acyl-lipid omega-6 desaturase (Delta-12 desaturase)
MDVTRNPTDVADLRSAIKPYEKPLLAASLFQFLSSLGLFVGATALMFWSLQLSYLLTLLLAVPTGALLVRIFIIQHDCGHGSFFKSRWANELAGRICSLPTLTPFLNWRRQHSQHHASWNNLDKHHSGKDIYSACLTVGEYRSLTRRQRFLYRLPRHPLIANVLIPPLVFLFLYRVPFDTPKAWVKERRSVYWLNAVLAGVVGVLGTVLGFLPLLLIYLPVLMVTTTAGVWLFSVQHRFDTSLWMRQGEWSFASASLQGSSFLKLPKLLQWFTGNIGFHHVHHFAPLVPNYRLERCYRKLEGLRAAAPLTLRSAMKALRLTLWDENRRCFVRFKDISPVAG